MKAILRQLRVSSKKANLVASLVRNKTVTEAIQILQFTTKKTAEPLRKLIESAAANAENNFNQDRDDLYLKEIVVTEGTTLKRGLPVSRGRMHPILKRTAHITVKLASLGGGKKSAKVKTTTKSAKSVEESSEEKEAKKTAKKKTSTATKKTSKVVKAKTTKTDVSTT